MSKETEDELKDVVVWYEHHKRDAAFLDGKIAFMETVVQNLINVTILQSADIQRLEHRDPGDPDKKAFDFGSLIVKA